MELFNSATTSINNPLLSPLLPIFSPKFHFRRVTIPISKRYFPFHPSFCNPSSRFKLYAHLRRPTKRQNYLRKKLTQQKVSKESIIGNPGLNSVFESKDSGVYDDSNTVNNVTESIATADALESKKRLVGDSPLLNKLEGWVEQYKRDVEFWGIGNGPVFTVFQDSEMKVQRVEVNEDEILRRSGIKPSSFSKDSKNEAVMDVSSKISYAQELAREMESGNNVLPGNSSIAKFIVSGANLVSVNAVTRGVNSGFVNVIQSVTRTPGVFPKLSRLGVLVCVGLVMVWAIRKLFAVGKDGRRYTISEKKMLSRKLKARAQREKIVKGSVEILQESVEPEYVPLERPMLDREELMKNITEAKGSTNKLAIEEYLGNEKANEDSSVEVLQESVEPEYVHLERPMLDREELMKNIIEVKGSPIEYLGNEKANNEHFSNKIQEIREMARRAREIENRDGSSANNDAEDIQTDNMSNQKKVSQKQVNGHIDSQVNFPDGNVEDINDDDVTKTPISSNDLMKSTEILSSEALNVNVHTQSSTQDVENRTQNSPASIAGEVGQQLAHRPSKSSRAPFRTGLRVIRSVDEAREFLSRKHGEQNVDLESKARSAELDDTSLTVPSERKSTENVGHKVDGIETAYGTSTSNVKPDLTESTENTPCKEKESMLTNNGSAEAVDVAGDRMSEIGKSTPFISLEGSYSSQKNKMPISVLARENKTDGNYSLEKDKDNKTFSQSILVRRSDFNPTLNASEDLKMAKDSSIPEEKICSENIEEGKQVIDHPVPGTSLGDSKTIRSPELEPSRRAEHWMEKNFHELEPIIKKMGTVVRDNYMTAKENINQGLNSKPETIQLNFNNHDSELAWMKDEKLRDIVFKVRDNELAGRDPFHLIGDEDKLAFFSGLEKKVEQENKKLLNLHEWLHSNIENLDYGADGISLYDPLEKIIPRWRGPPVDKIPEFLNNSMEQKMDALADNDIIKPMAQDSFQKPKESQAHDISSTIVAPDLHSKVQNEISKSSKTIIRSSDGSIRAGKKSGKEFWQHTKKWSQGFLDSYNAETDPEIKGVMKDVGKDLDRWVTEKDIQEAAEVMDKFPKTKKFIKEKLDKVRREVELFGPQAVVSKYREYGDDEEEDYLWWLDLPYVLCIELYTEEDGEQKVGLYSLEMAPDLELSPKPFHVIAFEDASDCKSLCYIIQHHMEMLGSGNAFVIARPPKDAFREAKANGFSVTVIGKGKVQLNVDQTLEDVEELITEIGSKIYHDRMMQERSADINALMKGVFGLKKSSRKRRRSKRKLKRPSRP